MTALANGWQAYHARRIEAGLPPSSPGESSDDDDDRMMEEVSDDEAEPTPVVGFTMAQV